ncbi:ABC-2 type transporter-domain-containing protein [Pholiota molesta]|nr:ABC-2 type transporter-domain-containing protein [Pholiota molesta]
MGKAAARSARSPTPFTMRKLPLALISLILAPVALTAHNTSSYPVTANQSSISQLTGSAGRCPPCFNCMLPAFSCGQFAECNKYDGQCKCPPGWSGIDCLEPQCDSLADGEHRTPRAPGTTCKCKDGWSGINCNVCKNDNACVGFPLAGGVVVDDPNDSTCSFQFWTAQVESFYCALQECASGSKAEYGTNSTVYDCQKIQCKCVPGRFLCGETERVDISDFLTQEIKGPAKFTAMNKLIDQIFGDVFITLKCDGGECLHYSQVPGYVVRPPKPDNRLQVALSAGGAFSFVLMVSYVLLWYIGRTRKGGEFGHIRLPGNEAAKLMTDHVPTSLYFSGITYSLGTKPILSNISGCKRGEVSGTTLVNGREVDDAQFKKVVGYVDQEDTLMSTLTVYETVLYSALLRLPREMSNEAKKFRTLETMEDGHRSISGGEKRRVSIACELPTSGLDAFNASNVVESLVALARNHNRTPRSNIVALFDQLVVLARGKLVPAQPRASGTATPTPHSRGTPSITSEDPNNTAADLSYAERGHHQTPPLYEDEAHATNVQITLHPPWDRPRARGRGARERKKRHAAEDHIEPALSALRDRAPNHEEGEALRREVVRADRGLAPSGGGVAASGAQPDVALETSMLRGRKRASYATQFRILSGRAFKNLFICGMFVHDVTNDIAGFQNRLGKYFLFLLALFGFSCLSSLGLFANERILFMRERSNGYYSSFTYFASKVHPLRHPPPPPRPPLLFGGIVYGLVGFVPTVVQFWKFLLALVLFNLTTASVVLWLSIAFASVSVASLVGTLIMLFNLLFTGLLINRNSMSMAFQWLHTISFFHAAFEALAVNELRHLQLKERKYGVELDVPAATILSTFGLRAQSYWWPNIALLGIFFATFTTASFITLHYYVKEKR